MRGCRLPSLVAMALLCFVPVLASAQSPLPSKHEPAPGLSIDTRVLQGAESVDGVWQNLSHPHILGDPCAIFDPVRGRMIVAGQFNVGYANEIWSLALAGTPGWSQLVPSGAGPLYRLGQSGIYDPDGDRMVLFGGYSPAVPHGSSAAYYNDVLLLSLAGSPA